MSAGDSRRRGLSEEERALWRGITRSVEPLRRGIAATADAAAPSAKTAARPQPAARGGTAPPLAPLDRSLKRRLARGTLAIDARLDLHGKTQSEAHAALVHFLRRAQGEGAKLVLVITGKGRRGSDDERGVLKRQVPLWLERPELRAYVVGFENAQVGHGGEGALYVRIRGRKTAIGGRTDSSSGR